MVDIDSLLWELDPRQIAQRIGIRHDEARLQYDPTCNTVSDNQEFSRVIADYWNHHWSIAIVRGSRMPEFPAMVQAGQVLDRICQRSGRSRQEVLWDAIEGTNGGLRSILDAMADTMKAGQVELYISGVIDEHVDPTSRDDQAEIVRQLFDRCRSLLPDWVDPDEPGMYVVYYKKLIRDCARLRSEILARLERT